MQDIRHGRERAPGNLGLTDQQKNALSGLLHCLSRSQRRSSVKGNSCLLGNASALNCASRVQLDLQLRVQHHMSYECQASHAKSGYRSLARMLQPRLHLPFPWPERFLVRQDHAGVQLTHKCTNALRSDRP